MSAIRRLTAVMVLALGAIIGWAPAASAHAVLLRTDPSPQTTVAQSPSAVRLFFSEPVEVTLGAIRVFDVVGHRADGGTLNRSRDHRQVAVPLPHLDNGTYTVTWKAVSADGHLVHGGFTFYIGAPSTISAVAINPDAGPMRSVTWGAAAVRFVWFTAFLGIIGMAALRVWVWTPAVREAGATDSAAASRFRRRFRRGLPMAWIALVLAGAAQLFFQAASVAGSYTATRGVIHTTFGRLWLVAMAVTLALGLPVIALSRRHRVSGVAPAVWLWLGAIGVSALAVTTALNGHARTVDHPVLATASITAHLLSVGVWVGGLGALVLLAAPSWRCELDERRAGLVGGVVRRFSRIALVAVTVIVVTGVINALADFGSISDLWRVGYGRVVATKVILLAIALAFGTFHLFVVPRRLRTGRAAPVRSFERTTLSELATLVITIALAAALVAMVPGRSLALAASGEVNQEHRAGAYTLQLFLDPTRIGANEI
ncbi:MAG: copper transport protein, partial [Acidimicrobiaceae bacterium]|nr:copper transport protein [Acidimicrobiaceae bacterium]